MTKFTLGGIILYCFWGDAIAANIVDDNIVSTPDFSQVEFTDTLTQSPKLGYFDKAVRQEQLDDVISNSNDATLDLNLEQRKLAKEHNQDIQNYSIISNNFYEDERIRFFNYTAYTTEDLKNRLGAANSGTSSGQGLTVSFGYGVEYKINQLNRIGYEYLSSFPYDRGQLIRFFWVRAL